MIPNTTKMTIDLYVEKGIKPGGFVHACLANDLIRAIQIADCTNFPRLKYIVDYILENVPAEGWGSYETVAKWMQSKQ